jgi:hypothetical protein
VICLHCLEFSTKRVEVLLAHWWPGGCPWGREVWKKVMESKIAGHSGRRLLHERWPNLWPSDPMSEETKGRLREIAQQRKESGVKVMSVRAYGARRQRKG